VLTAACLQGPGGEPGAAPLPLGQAGAAEASGGEASGGAATTGPAGATATTRVGGGRRHKRVRTARTGGIQVGKKRAATGLAREGGLRASAAGAAAAARPRPRTPWRHRRGGLGRPPAGSGLSKTEAILQVAAQPWSGAPRSSSLRANALLQAADAQPGAARLGIKVYMDSGAGASLVSSWVVQHLGLAVFSPAEGPRALVGVNNQHLG
jgi:hypothetical protein